MLLAQRRHGAGVRSERDSTGSRRGCSICAGSRASIVSSPRRTAPRLRTNWRRGSSGSTRAARGIAALATRARRTARDVYAAAAHDANGTSAACRRRRGSMRRWRASSRRLKLDAARFRTGDRATSPRRSGVPDGRDRVEFLVSTNPGAPFAPLTKIASVAASCRASSSRSRSRWPRRRARAR